jgi:type I restriction enzyme M protein
VGVAPGEELSDEDFRTQVHVMNEELEGLNAWARGLEQTMLCNEAEIPGV